MLKEPPLFGLDGAERLAPAPLLGVGQDAGRLGRAELVIDEGARPQEGRIRGPRQGREPPVQDGEAQLLDHLAATAGEGVWPFIRGADPGHLQGGLHPRLHGDPGLQATGGNLAKVRIISSRTLDGPAAKGLDDLGLHGVHVEIAGGHQQGPLGPVIGLVEVPDGRGRGGAQDLHIADGIAVVQTLILEQEGQPALVQAVGRGIAGPFFRQNDAPLAIDRILGDQQAHGRFPQ